jgi:transcriptional regulator with XRE-family HTH domain
LTDGWHLLPREAANYGQVRGMAMDQDHVQDTVGRIFARQEGLDACRRRDLGAIVRLCAKYGITQGQIAGMTGIGQGRLSEYARGKRSQPTLDTLESFADGMALPAAARRALGLTPAPGLSAVGDQGFPTDTFDLLRLAEAIGRTGQMRRRQMLALAAGISAGAAIAQSEVWERIGYALTRPAGLDEAMVRAIEARSAGFHQLEELVPAAALYKGLTAHLRETGNLLNGVPAATHDDFRKRLIVAVGESSVLAGWLASDMGDPNATSGFYQIAERAATEADDPAIAACALAYKSYVPSTKGGHGRSRLLLTTALEAVSEHDSPATVAWLAARYAEESAALADVAQATESWARAEEAFGIADPHEDRVWTRFMDQNRFDSYHISMLAGIHRLDEAQELAAIVLGRLDQPDRKKAVIILEGIAAAHLTRGSVTDACAVGRQALSVLRETEFTMWLPKFEALAHGLTRWQRAEPVRAFLEEYGVTKRQLTPSRR